MYSVVRRMVVSGQVTDRHQLAKEISLTFKSFLYNESNSDLIMEMKD